MVLPSSPPDGLTGIRAARRAAAVRLSQDSPTKFRARQLNAQPPSFSQWSLVMPAPSPAESRPSSSLRSPAARQASGEYAQRSEHLLARNTQSTIRNQSRPNPNPPPQAEDDAEAVAYIFNQCVSTYSSSHDMISALELTHLVGVGSMGTVYRASLLGQQVVCKVIEHGNDAPFARVKDTRGRAILEGQLGRLLSHPNVVAGYGTFSGTFPHSRLCIAGSAAAGQAPHERTVTLLLQEFCSRGTLRAALQGGALYAEPGADGAAADAAFGAPLRRLKVLAQVAGQVAFGLAHLHAHGTVHCDLNASNVFLQPLAEEMRVPGSLSICAKIGDLGVACVLPSGKGAADTTVDGAMHGTMSHMPPEALSRQHAVSAATDIWSFGMLLWELWTLEVPFDGLSPQAIVSRVLAHELLPWPKETPQVLVQIAGRCWSRDPRERPEAQALASTFAKLAAVLKEADADPRSPVAAGAGAAGPAVKGGAAPPSALGPPPPLPEDDLEDALLAGSLNVDLLQEPPSAGDSAATGTSLSEVRLTLEQCRPQVDDNVAQLLWEMLHLPDPQACQEVQVSPLHSIVVAPLPYLNNYKYREDPLPI